jgi:predicted outer membrane repeat protein
MVQALPVRRVLGLTAALALAAGSVHAGGVVGNGTPQSCTEAALVARLAGGGTVTFNCGAPVVIPFTSAKTLTATTTIDGSGQSITFDGGNATRFFQTTFGFSPIVLTFRNILMRNGRAPDFGGAIRLAYQDPPNWTLVNLDRVYFVSNTAAAAGNDVGGGAIYALGGYLNMSRCIFAGNRGGNGGALGSLAAVWVIEDTLFEGNGTHAQTQQFAGNGGAIYIDGSTNSVLTIRRSTFRQNSATNLGGAIHLYQYAGASGMVIEDSTFDRNSTVNNGGAIYHQNGTLSVARSTFTGNQTVGQGGALWLLEASSVTLSNSTFTGNRANGFRPNPGTVGLGGAMIIHGSSNVTISHCTIVGNFADWVGGGIVGGMSGGSTTTLRGSIVAGNTAANGGNTWNIAHNCSRQLLDGGYNIQFPSRANPTDPNDPNCTAGVIIAQPNLAVLGSQGGPTDTMPPSPGSPAIDAVAAGCPAPSMDQRGRTRPEGPRCDIGAVEGPAGLFADGFDAGDASAWTAAFPLF